MRLDPAIETRRLLTRIVELEGERSDAYDQTRRLMLLQKSFRQVSVAETTRAVVREILLASREALGFSRSFIMTVDPALGQSAMMDGSDTVEPSDDAIEIRQEMGDALRDGALSGFGNELSAPLVDVRGWYVLTSLHRGPESFAYLYVDGHRNPRPREWEIGLVATLSSIAASALYNVLLLARAREQAATDPLTGLLNRRSLHERLSSLIEASRRRGRSIAYVLLDVDNFKAINDSYGHLRGDSVLQEVAATLLRSCRPDDCVGRYAGDEFALILTDVGPADARAMVARISENLRAARLSCSIGAALLPGDANDATALIAAADRALYAAKAAGKNRFAFFHPSDC